MALVYDDTVCPSKYGYMNQQEKTQSAVNRKTLSGVIVSTNMQDTAVVAVNRYVKHPLYGKYRRTTKRYKAHNPGDSFSVGDQVTIESCRPISKEKHFRVLGTTEDKK